MRLACRLRIFNTHSGERESGSIMDGPGRTCIRLLLIARGKRGFRQPVQHSSNGSGLRLRTAKKSLYSLTKAPYRCYFLIYWGPNWLPIEFLRGGP